MEYSVSTIMSYAEDHNTLCPRKHGSRKGYSRQTQLLGLVSEITYKLEKWKQIDLAVNYGLLKGLQKG